MIRRKVMNEVGGYWEGFECQDGYDIWLKITKLYEVGNINLPLFYYRQHGNNLTKNELKILHTRHRMIEKSINESNDKKPSNGATNFVSTRSLFAILSDDLARNSLPFCSASLLLSLIIYCCRVATSFEASLKAISASSADFRDEEPFLRNFWRLDKSR